MLELKNVSFFYAQGDGAGGVKNICMTIQSGEVVLLCGESGCGKTTLTCLINGLIPHYYEGELGGQILLNGVSIPDTPLYNMAAEVGSVFQNPRSQFFNVDTTSELAFGCENLGMPEDEILFRVGKAVSDFHISSLMGRSIFALSGGEKQKVACASVAALEPEIIVLDEPSSNLDAAAIEELRKVLLMWKCQGKTLIIAEHRLHYLQGVIDRAVYLREGRIERTFTSPEFSSLPAPERESMGLRPFNFTDLKEFRPALPFQAQQTLRLSRFCFAYKRQMETLCIKDVLLPKGGVIAVIGLNGAGKSTLAQCVCGLKKCGVMELEGKALDWRARLRACYMVMQDVNHQLFTESVLEEILLSQPGEDETAADKILAEFNLLKLRERHPLSLSGGQKQRVAIASAIASGREVILFDEPTSGLDLRHMRAVAGNLRLLAERGKTLLVVTHDPELILSCCTHVLHIEDGAILSSYPLDVPGIGKMLLFFERGGEEADKAGYRPVFERSSS